MRFTNPPLAIACTLKGAVFTALASFVKLSADSMSRNFCSCHCLCAQAYYDQEKGLETSGRGEVHLSPVLSTFYNGAGQPS